MPRDLLNPTELKDQYIHQISQTINAYDQVQIVIGEALQNALDAIVEMGGGRHKITIEMDLDSRTICILDDGIGFPNDPNLLFLGGSRKRESGKNIFGLVGVGIKVVVFSSSHFLLRSNHSDGNFRFEITDAYKFNQPSPPDLPIPDSFEADSEPLGSRGSELTYTFPEGLPNDPLIGFFRHIEDACLEKGYEAGFANTIQRAYEADNYDSRLSALLDAYFRRFTYLGDVATYLEHKDELNNTTIEFRVKATDAEEYLGSELATFFEGQDEVTLVTAPKFLTAAETAREWVDEPRPGLFRELLGRGGTNLQRTHRGINILKLFTEEEFESLLIDSRGNASSEIEKFRSRLFPYINGIVLTIARIPIFSEYLPGGSMRVISANGVVTTHELPLEKGRNQEYVRCIDFILDLDADLNYGKSQITNKHLVGLSREFINEAYGKTLQTAAGNWVGRIRVEEPEYDTFLGRQDLPLDFLSMKKEPHDEDDVIALFFELVGRGYLEGYKVFGLSQIDQYDCRAVIKYTSTDVDPDIPPDDRQLKVVEFKLKASSLIQDLSRGSKNSTDIDLLIAWSEGTSSSEIFAFTDIEHSDYNPDRLYSGVTKYLSDSRTGAQIQVILLDNVVAGIEAPEE